MAVGWRTEEEQAAFGPSDANGIGRGQEGCRGESVQRVQTRVASCETFHVARWPSGSLLVTSPFLSVSLRMDIAAHTSSPLPVLFFAPTPERYLPKYTIPYVPSPQPRRLHHYPMIIDSPVTHHSSCAYSLSQYRANVFCAVLCTHTYPRYPNEALSLSCSLYSQYTHSSYY